MIELHAAAQRFLSYRFQDYREYWNLTQADLAGYLAVSLRTVQRWEGMETMPDWPTWARVVIATDLKTNPRPGVFLVEFPA
jgi:DNA-binding transcriptional regulator YiaG